MKFNFTFQVGSGICLVRDRWPCWRGTKICHLSSAYLQWTIQCRCSPSHLSYSSEWWNRCMPTSCALSCSGRHSHL